MIKSLRMVNFRKVLDDTMVFTPGLNVVRGSNEASKSTRLEAISYAIAGAKSCRESLDKVVTWGQPDKSLKVELTLEIDGVEYHIKRSKSGAEINYGGDGKVVGQTEVTAFMERLLGVSSQNSGRLMFASQNSIRGALSEGSEKTMALIESLSDFEVIDRVISLVQENYLTGPTTTAIDRLARAQEGLKSAQEAVKPVDVSDLEQQVVDNTKAIVASQKEAEVWEPKVKAAMAALEKATATEARRNALIDQQTQTLSTGKRLDGDMAAALKAAADVPEDGAIERAEAQLEDAKQREVVVNAQAAITSLLASYPDPCWEGDEPSFQVALQASNKSVADGQALVAGVEASIKSLKGQIQTGEGACKSCGQALPNAAAVAAHNAKLNAEIEKLKAEGVDLQRSLQEARENLAAMLGIQKVAAAYYVAATKHAEVVTVDWNFVPPKLSWNGPVLGEVVNTAALTKHIEQLKAQQRRAQDANVKIGMLSKAKAEVQAEWEKLDEQVKACGESRVHESRAQLEEVSARYNGHANAVNELRAKVKEVENLIEQVKAGAAVQQRAVKVAEESVEKANKDLADLEFNNNLLKRVRTARPIIADKLWGIVLASVSSYFSAMRGTPAVVTREGKEFKVDSHAIDGLSGSTLDILGLSIRLALTRTFLPNAPFLILDEPAAACDDERENAMLGFLVAAGFPQTILVTHSDVEAVAQNLITV